MTRHPGRRHRLAEAADRHRIPSGWRVMSRPFEALPGGEVTTGPVTVSLADLVGQPCRWCGYPHPVGLVCPLLARATREYAETMARTPRRL